MKQSSQTYVCVYSHTHMCTIQRMSEAMFCVVGRWLPTNDEFFSMPKFELHMNKEEKKQITPIASPIGE